MASLLLFHTGHVVLFVRESTTLLTLSYSRFVPVDDLASWNTVLPWKNLSLGKHEKVRLSLSICKDYLPYKELSQ
jgi:hypothetical protein